MIKTIIFDLDDTLLECSRYYQERKMMFAEQQSTRLGISTDICYKILTDMDITCTELDHGFSKHRFPRSFAAASAALDLICGKSVNESAAEESYMLGQSVFDAPYELVENAVNVLQSLKDDGYLLVLWTKGDYDVQTKKIVKNNLFQYFKREHVYITSKKTPECIKTILFDTKADPHETALIGDSLRDDIRCGNVMNVTTVWVRRSLNFNWAYENQSHEPTYIVERIEEVPHIFSVSSTALVF